MAEVPDHFKAQEMRNKAVEKGLWSLMNVPDCFKKQDICIKAAEKYPLLLIEVPDHFKTQEMKGSPFTIRNLGSQFDVLRVLFRIFSENCEWSIMFYSSSFAHYIK